MCLATDAADSAAAPDATAAPDAGDAVTVVAGADSAPSAAPGDGSFQATIIALNPDSLDGVASDASGTTVAPKAGEEVAVVPDDTHVLKSVVSTSL